MLATVTGPVSPPADPAPPRRERGRGRRPELVVLLVLALVIGVVGGGAGAYHLLGARDGTTSTTSETPRRRADPSAEEGAPAGRDGDSRENAAGGAAPRGAVDSAAGSRAAQTAVDGLIQSLVMGASSFKNARIVPKSASSVVGEARNTPFCALSSSMFAKARAILWPNWLSRRTSPRTASR